MALKKYTLEQMIKSALSNKWIGKEIYYDFYLDTNKIMVSENNVPKHSGMVLDVKVETILNKHHVYFLIMNDWVEVISLFHNTF